MFLVIQTVSKYGHNLNLPFLGFPVTLADLPNDSFKSEIGVDLGKSSVGIRIFPDLSMGK